MSTLAKYVDLDEVARKNYVAGDLSDETKLPRELLVRLYEMWYAHQRPFFDKVTEDGVLSPKDLAEVVRGLGISDVLLCNSIAGAICDGQPVTFEVFVRGYAALHSRTLREALPFAFKVFDLDGDGVLGPTEFKLVLSANLKHQELDAASVNRVLAAGTTEAPEGMTRDNFRYFASLTAETVLASCGFMLHVKDFYVPLTPLGTEEEERQEEEERRRKREGRARQAADASANGGAAAAEGEATGGEGAEEDEDSKNPFEDGDFLAALESLKTTPEERAMRRKEKGNDALKQGKIGFEKAVEHYTKGLEERPNDAALEATLRSNRAAAHVMLKNWGFAYADATAALELAALPEAQQLKAARRAAKAALKLGKLPETREALERGRAAVAAVAAAASSATAPDGELEEIARELAEHEAEVERRRVAAEAEAQQKAALEAALSARGVRVSDFADEQLREQVVGASSGARVWYDAEEDALHWPCLVLYPEVGMSDFVQDVHELDALQPHLVEMFGAHGELAPDWDRERKYAPAQLKVYVSFPGEDDAERTVRLNAERPLFEQLRALQPQGYAVPGIPIVHVVVGGSAYEKEFRRLMRC